MNRDMPILAMTMNRAHDDAERFYERERERIEAEYTEKRLAAKRPARAPAKKPYEQRVREQMARKRAARTINESRETAS